MSLDVNKRLAKLKKSVENAKTEVRRQSNKKIFERLLVYIKDSKDETEFYAHLLNDYPAFCAWLIDGKDEPFIPAPWQISATERFVKYDRMFLLNCRRAGKSSWASSVIVWDMCRRENANHLIFAPTKQQLLVMTDVYKVINNSDFILHTFVKGGNVETNRMQKVAFVNGSSVEAFNIGVGAQEKKGDYLRGMGGNVIWIDEIGLVDEAVRKEVINPIIREAYGENSKKMIMFGTPKLAYNPSLEQEWEARKASDTTATMQVTCWQAMKEGIRTAEMMREVFQEDLYIPCKHVTTHGICPEYAPEMLEGTPKGWKCDQNYICMQNDRFMMEDLASFPNNADRFFPKEWLEDARQPYTFYEVTTIKSTDEYVMAVDLGLLQDPTEIVVAQVLTDPVTRIKKLKYAYWSSVHPWKEGETVESASRRHVEQMRRIFHTFNPKILYVDVTRGVEYVQKLVDSTIGQEDQNFPPPIPKSRFFANEAMEKKEGIGIWWDGHYKSKMYLNHKDQLQRRNIIVPNDPQFYEKWFQDHYETKAEPAHAGQYLQFGKKSRHLLDACAMLSLALEVKGPSKAAMDLIWMED